MLHFPPEQTSTLPRQYYGVTGMMIDGGGKMEMYALKLEGKHENSQGFAQKEQKQKLHDSHPFVLVTTVRRHTIHERDVVRRNDTVLGETRA